MPTKEKEKNHSNEISICRKLIADSVKDNLVLKTKIDTKEASKVASKPEIIYNDDKEAESMKNCEYFNFKTKGARLLLKHQKAMYFKCDVCVMIAVSMKHLRVQN